MNALVPNANLPAALQEYLKSLGGQQDDLGAGISAGFAVISYKGKNWRTRFRGDETLITRDMVMGDGSKDPAASIEVVILKASPHISKVWYEKGFVEGEMAPPDCFSTHGIVPDAASVKPQASACAACPKNVMGSKITDNGKKAKACSDSKRLAVVPLTDIDNAIFGGPMLLRTPAASLREIKSYSDTLNQKGIPYFALGTRVSFDTSEAFPKLLFSPVRVLNDLEIQKVIDYRADERVGRILDTGVEAARETTEAAAAAAPADPFANLGPVPAAALKPVTPEVSTAPEEDEDEKALREAQERVAAKKAAAAGAAKFAAEQEAKAKAEAEAKAAAEAAAAAAPAEEEDEDVKLLREAQARLAAKKAKAAAEAAAAASAQDAPAAPVIAKVTKGKAKTEAPTATASPVAFDNMLDSLLPN